MDGLPGGLEAYGAMSALAAVLDASWKGTALLAIAALTVLALRQGSAALRHLVWSLALVGVLALPVASPLLPAVEVSGLPHKPGGTAVPRAIETPQPMPGAMARATTGHGRTAQEHVGPRGTSGAPEHDHRPRLPDAGVSATLQPASRDTAMSHPGPSQTQGSLPTSGPARGELARVGAWIRRRAPAWLLGLWLAGVVVGAARIAIGLGNVAFLARRSRDLAGTPLHGRMRTLAGRLGLRRPVRLLEGDSATLPMTWGLLRPTVLVPRRAHAWPARRQRAALLHELVHIQRHDCSLHLLAQIAGALHWFNPLVWMAVRQLRIERENACDDRVLELGTRASEYAQHLVDIARAARPVMEPACGSLALAGGSTLDGRVEAILDPDRRRDAPNRRTQMVTVTTFLALLLPLAAMQPAAAVATASDPAELPAPEAGKPNPIVEGFETTVVPRSVEAGASSGSASRQAAGVSSASTAQEEADPSLDDLIRMRIHGVTSDFIEEVTALLGPVDVDDLLQMRIHGVVPRMIRALDDLGYANLTIHDLVQMRIHGIDEEFIHKLGEVGFASPPVGDLVQMAIHGVSAEFVGAVRDAGLAEVGLDDLVQMRIHGATPEFVGAMRALGYEQLSVDDVVRMRIHGITVDLVRRLQEAGYEDLTVDELVDIKIHGMERILLRRRGGR